MDVTGIVVTDNDVLTADIMHVNGLSDTVTVDLIRHDIIRNMVAALAQEIKKYTQQAESLNCAKCVGACCMVVAHDVIIVPYSDVIRIAEHLKLPEDEVIYKYFDEVNTFHEGRRFALKLKKNKDAAGGGCCVFLDVDKLGVGRCSIYDARPVQPCRQFSASDCEVFIPVDKLSIHRKWYK